MKNLTMLSWLLYGLVVLSTLAIHELGHWTQLHALRIPLRRVTLGAGPALRVFGRFYLGIFPIGASVTPSPEHWAEASPLGRFRVAIGGPIASFCAGIIMTALAVLYPAQLRPLMVFGALHFILGMANLIPVPPLDGWVALKELCEIRQRPLSPKVLNLASRAGNGLLYGVGFWCIGKMLTGEL